MATKISVVETSLYMPGEEHTRVLRHLGIRAGEPDDFVECHFGPDNRTDGSFRQGFLDIGEGEISESPYMGVIPCGTTLTEAFLCSKLLHLSYERDFLSYLQYCCDGEQQY
jgi:hypothetical protein